MNNVVITAAKCGFGLVRSTSDNIIFSHALHASDVASVCDQDQQVWLLGVVSG